MVSPTRSWISLSTTTSSIAWGVRVEMKARSERRGRAFMTIESGSEEHVAFCRDRGWMWRGRGGLVPVPGADIVRWFRENRGGSDGEEGQAQGPRPSVSGGNEDRHKAPAHPHRPPPVPTDGGEGRCGRRGSSGSEE